MSYKTEMWDYTDDSEALERLIHMIRDTKQVIVMYDSEFPTGRGVFYFGKNSPECIEESDFICDRLNQFYSENKQ